jgi:hypothetical protein
VHIPLRYQVSEFDCGPTAVMNAVSFLFPTEETPPEFVKVIYQCSLDDVNGSGMVGRMGTSSAALEYLTEWFNRYHKHVGFPMHCRLYRGTEVHLKDDSPIISCLKEGGAAVVKCILECEHYVTLTGIDKDYVHVFDPYYWDVDFGREGIIRVNDRPREMNRKIARNIMDCENACDDYAFCSPENRVAMLFYKDGKAKSLA